MAVYFQRQIKTGSQTVLTLYKNAKLRIRSHKQLDENQIRKHIGFTSGKLTKKYKGPFLSELSANVDVY